LSFYVQGARDYPYTKRSFTSRAKAELYVGFIPSIDYENKFF